MLIVDGPAGRASYQGSSSGQPESYMNELHLTSEEIEVLRDLLRHTIDEMDVEVFRTDTHNFKQMLKHRRETIEHILNKISAVPVLE